MSQPDSPYTSELLDRMRETIAQYRRDNGQGIDVPKLAVVLAANRVGLIDTERHRSWIDETVHMGALFRLNFWRKLAEAREPVPMILFCPKCGTHHIDAPDPATEWTNPPHRSHLCAACGLIWRPADICTVGVEKIETRGLLDTLPAEIVAVKGDGKIVLLHGDERIGISHLLVRVAEQARRSAVEAVMTMRGRGGERNYRR